MKTILEALKRTGRSWQRVDELPLVQSKFARIGELVEDKDLLDVGCIGDEDGADFSQTSHAILASKARDSWGIDLNAAEIERWRKAGRKVIVSDAETFSISQKFDVIVAADVIEHLSNPGQFLRRVREHLRPEGLLCIVTPNALSLNSAFKSLAGLQVSVNPQHTCWYDRATLHQLLARFSFKVIEEYWQDYQSHPLASIVLRFRPNLASHLIVVACMASLGVAT